MFNFDKSFYSKTKAYTQELLKCYKNVLLLRIRMPIDNTNNPKNFIEKLKSFDKIISVPNSMTVLPEMIPIMVTLIATGQTGTWNCVNPNVISHKEILNMLGIQKEYVDISHQSELTRVARSNNHLATTKIEKFCADNGLTLNEIHTAIAKLLQNEKIRC